MADTFTAAKLAAVDRVLFDKRATPLSFRVFWYLASATDRETGIAKRKQQTIADDLGVTRRAVQQSIKGLAGLGHLMLISKEGGTYTNAYRVVAEKTNLASHLSTTKANGSSPSTSYKLKDGSSFLEKRRTGRNDIVNGPSENGEQSFASILPFNSHYSLSARETASAKALLLLGVELTRAMGADAVHAWLRKATIAELFEDTLTIELPNRFIRDRVERDYEPLILRCCKALVPQIGRLRLVTVGAQAAA